MSKINSLFLLVKSLSKSEKRYFKLASNLQKGSKDYLFLFNLIDQGIEVQDLKSAFLAKNASASFEVCCSYLYKLILDGMLKVRSEKQTNHKLINDILKVDLLFEKGLYEEGFKLINQVEETAEKLEFPMIKLWASSLELTYIANHTLHAITETELLQKQMKIKALLKYNEHINQHTSLYQLLRHRLIHLGNVRSQQQKNDLNDLLMAELSLLSKSYGETFESQKNHLLFQAYYLIAVGDFKSALKTFYELDHLFKSRQHLWAATPIDYLSTISGVLNSLQGIRDYDGMLYFVDQLLALKTNSDQEEVNRIQIIYVYQLIRFLNNGSFEEGQQMVEKYQDVLFKRMNFLPVSKQAEVFLYTAILYLCLGNMKKAHLYLNHILLENNSFYHLPIYRTSRLIHLLIHFELKNHDYLEHEIRSFKRSLKKDGHKVYLIEQLILGFIQQRKHPSGSKARLLYWKKIEPKFEKIKGDKFESQALLLFNFITWIEAKLSKKTFQELIIQRHVKS